MGVSNTISSDSLLSAAWPELHGVESNGGIWPTDFVLTLFSMPFHVVQPSSHSGPPRQRDKFKVIKSVYYLASHGLSSSHPASHSLPFLLRLCRYFLLLSLLSPLFLSFCIDYPTLTLTIALTMKTGVMSPSSAREDTGLRQGCNGDAQLPEFDLDNSADFFKTDWPGFTLPEQQDSSQMVRTFTTKMLLVI